jgi:hypothetical protein
MDRETEDQITDSLFRIVQLTEEIQHLLRSGRAASKDERREMLDASEQQNVTVKFLKPLNWNDQSRSGLSRHDKP